MSTERWRRISEIYQEALGVERQSERAAIVAARCGGDDGLRREVESLLRHDLPSAPAMDAVAAALRVDPDTLLDVRLGPYVLRSFIGAGGMGRVYRADDTVLGRPVAIKLLAPELAHDPERRARLDREAHLLATLSHPNIAAIFGIAEGDGLRGLVLELVEGETLAERLERASPAAGGARRLPIPDALAIARQVAQALDAAHERGVIHRDLKPANLKIAPDGTVKVLDFGLAKATSPDDGRADAETRLGVTQAGMILGTATYMSPEQARGQPVGKRTDIWAFGCVLYEMLSGRVPFEGETVPDVLAAVLDREPDWSALPTDLPPAVGSLLRRCLDKDVRRRLRDIGDAFEALSDGFPRDPGQRSDARRRGLAGIERFAWAAVASAVAVAAAFAAWPARPGAEPPLFRRVVRLTNGPGSEFGPAISPDGKWVAYFDDAAGSAEIWVRFVSGGVASRLTSTSGLELPTRIAIGGLAISPDGASIAFDAGAAPGTPANLFDSWVVPAPLGGTPRKLVERGRSVRWSPDGRRITYVRAGANAGDSLYVADADGANERQIVGTRGGMHIHWPAWSADGGHVYFIYSPATQNDEPAEIYRVPSRGGVLEPVVTTVRRALFPAPLPDGLGLLYAANTLTSDLAVWWQPIGSDAPPRPVLAGVGEYGELSVSRAGGRAVGVVTEPQQSMALLPLTSAREELQPFGDGSNAGLDPTIDPSGTQVVFTSSRDGSRNLWRSRIDGSEARALTSGQAFDERPAFSPDGRRLAFVSDRDGSRGIWIMNADGGAPRLVIHARVSEGASWSPDGRRLVYSANGEAGQALSIVDVDTGATSALPTPGPATVPVWSPAGSVIAYVEAQPPEAGRPSSSRVALIRSDGSPMQPRLLESPNVLNGFIAWSPDGRHLAAVVEPGAAASSVWVLDSEGTEKPRRLATMPASTRVRGVAWLPTGKALVVGQNRRTTDVVLMEP